MSDRGKLSADLKANWQKAKNVKPRKKPGKKEILGPEILRGLEYVFQITGDPIFSDAKDALKSYGLDHKLRQRAAPVYDDLMSSPQISYYKYMRNWIDAHKRKLGSDRLVFIAAETLAADNRFDQGSSFETDCENLRRGYSKWAKSGYPDQKSAQDGSLGRKVWVVPIDGKPLKIGSYRVPASGAAKLYDLFLRRLFLDGTILIAHLADE